MSVQTQETTADMSGNPHYASTVYSLAGTILSSDVSGTQTVESLLMDNAHASLAVAYEQRTANLIALLGMVTAPHGREQLHSSILERMGL